MIVLKLFYLIKNSKTTKSLNTFKNLISLRNSNIGISLDYNFKRSAKHYHIYCYTYVQSFIYDY